MIWLLPRPLGSLPVLGAGHPGLRSDWRPRGSWRSCPRSPSWRPAADWSPEAVLVPPLLFSFYAYVGAAHLRGTASLDAAFVAALLGVVLLGPLAGALVFAAPELTRLGTTDA